MTMIENVLKPGETIVWGGKPKKEPSSAAYNVMKSLVISSLAIFVLVLVRAPNSPLYHMLDPNHRGFIVLGIIIFIYIVLKAPLVQSGTKIAEYAITDQRIVITYNTPFNKVRAFPLDAINSIKIEKGNKDGQEIVFGEYILKGGVQYLVNTSELGKKKHPRA